MKAPLNVTALGSAGQPLFLDLPGGGSARIVTKRDTYPAGRDFVGYGIRPAIPVAPSVEDIRTGRDAAPERAPAFLRSEPTNARR
jgi:C-terminal processing protease CtpA/Prc